jgi:excisionase family DNA binding protein
MVAAQTLQWSDLPAILTVAEAAAFLRMPKSGVYGAIKAGLLPAMNAGQRRTRIAKAALQKTFGIVMEAAHETAAFGRNLEAYL